MQKKGMRQALDGVMEACAQARAKAILDGTPMELRIRPADRSFSVAGATVSKEEMNKGTGAFMFDGDKAGSHSSGSDDGDERLKSFTLPTGIIVEGLGVNGEDWTTDEEARVRFYPNGTSDEMSIVLLSDKGERRNIYLEVVTGFAEVEVDPLKFRDR